MYAPGTKPAKSGLFLLGGQYLYSWTGEAQANLGSTITYFLPF